jgi:hypothetical protein
MKLLIKVSAITVVAFLSAATSYNDTIYKDDKDDSNNKNSEHHAQQGKVKG